MNIELKQARDSTISLISENPSIASWTSVAQIDNGYGEMIDDPSGATVDHKEKVRIAHKEYTTIMLSNEETPVGLSKSQSLYIIMKWNTEITEGTTITCDATKYKIGVVDSFYKNGEIYRNHATLLEVA